jgi:hypothetical protein
VIKSRRLKWAGHVAHMSREIHMKLLENLRGRGHSESLGIYWIILKWVLEK